MIEPTWLDKSYASGVKPSGFYLIEPYINITTIYFMNNKDQGFVIEINNTTESVRFWICSGSVPSRNLYTIEQRSLMAWFGGPDVVVSSHKEFIELFVIAGHPTAEWFLFNLDVWNR